MRTLIKKCALFVTLLITVVTGIAWEYYPLHDASDRLALLTQSTLGFQSVNVPLLPAEQEVFGDAAVIKRMYRRGEICFVLTAIDGTANRQGIHDPLYCFRGAGWEIINTSAVKMRNGEGRRVLLQRNHKNQEVLYWFTDGSARYPSVIRYWWQSTLRRLTMGATGGEPVLIQLMPCSGRSLPWQMILNEFIPVQEI